ncbi:MAG: hypothetical protein ABIJ09_23785 [Pseudomonadota bacterium]
MDRKLIAVGAASGVGMFLLAQVVWALVKPIPYQEDLLQLPPRSRSPVGGEVNSDPTPVAEDPTVPVALPDPGAAASDEAITFISMDGPVERKTGSTPWAAIMGKERVEPGDMLRVTEGGKAELQFGANSVLTLRQGSQLSVRHQEISTTHFVLQSGQIEITSLTQEKKVIVSGPRGMEMRAENARTEVFVFGAIFGAVNNAGRVELRSGKRALDVPEGMAGWAVAGKPPLPPRVFTGDPELEVTQPRGSEVKTASIVFKGSAHPLAQVQVNGRPVKLRADGGFVARVPLDEGDNNIEVTASLLGGEPKTVELPTITRVAKASLSKPKSKAKPKPKPGKKAAPKKGAATIKWGAGS